MTRLVKIGAQVLPLQLQSVGVEDGEIVLLPPAPPMTYRGPVSFSFRYLDSGFSVQYLEIGKAARLKVTGEIATLPPRADKARRNRVLALIDIMQDDVGNGLSIGDDGAIRFAAESPLVVPVSAERLMVGLCRALAWHKPLLRLVQEEAAGA
ncbi:hypothetical protein [Oleispirillum naphthae]|uniref:hypothetical protein n=1 Tax=Oleispirillum naphthae TaxID=2838853 RepID=UPI00308228AA